MSPASKSEPATVPSVAAGKAWVGFVKNTVWASVPSLTAKTAKLSLASTEPPVSLTLTW